MWILGFQGTQTVDVKTLAYQHDLAREAIKHAIEHLFDFVSRGLDLTPVITHRFPLERWSAGTRPRWRSRTRVPSYRHGRLLR